MQTLPVIKCGTKTNIINETIKSSSLWSKFKVFKLSKNMRNNNQEFASFLLSIGNGSIPVLKIPESWKTNDICTKIYGTNIKLTEDLSDKIILSSHNDDIYKINDKILNKIDSPSKVYYSIDYAKHKGIDKTEIDVELKYPTEYLHSLRFPSFPVHKLILKINNIVMLIRNLSVNDGLCNGTRLKIIELFKFNIKAEIITGIKKGSIVFIPRIILDTGEYTSLPFILYRRQFPVVLAFAMTINKAQGQSFETVGIYLNKPLFSHGQLYVAISRSKNCNKIFIQNDTENSDEIENIVWKEVL
jgi:ATP-dependent DNA helicase PIF1